MPVKTNKEVVRRYFKEALDGANVDIVDALFTDDCIIHRPEALEPLLGLDGIRRIIAGAKTRYSLFETTIHDLFGAGDRVVCRLSHRVVFQADWVSRIGRHAVIGKQIEWPAIAIFRFEDGKIAEEWVCRDELGMLLQIDGCDYRQS